ncbi:MAG: hypothetical protein J5940_04025 [Clostridia bacterium]|nr:hypothetical protein [Clostridia bacterium]
MKRSLGLILAAALLLALASCALPGMTVDFTSLHRINSPDAVAVKYGSVRETVKAGEFVYTVDTVYENGAVSVYETANGGVTAVSAGGAYYLKNGVYTMLLPCFQSYGDALAEYMTTIHPLDCSERWQRSSVTEDGVETVVYYKVITPALESEFSAYGLRDGAVLTMTYRLDEATSRFISITYAEEFGGETRTVCERTFEYGLGYEFAAPDGEKTPITVIGENAVTYEIPSGYAVGWLGTGTLYTDAERTMAFSPSYDFPATLYK